jgi:hypothetical protein
VDQRRVANQLRLAVLGAYDRMLGLELEQLAVDGCTTKAPCGGQVAGPSSVDRRKQGLKRSVAVEAGGIPLAALPAPANQRDAGLLAATLAPSRWSARCPPGRWCAWAPATTISLSACPGRARDGRPDRHPRHPGTDPGRPPMGD